MDEQERQQLNRDIAEALGYTVKGVPSLEDANRIAYYMMYDASGNSVGYEDDGMSFPLTGYNEAVTWERGTTDYAADLNAIAAALKGKPVHLTLGFERPCSARLVHESENPIYPTDILTDEYYATGETVEHAAAKATLSWALATKARAR